MFLTVNLDMSITDVIALIVSVSTLIVTSIFSYLMYVLNRKSNDVSKQMLELQKNNFKENIQTSREQINENLFRQPDLKLQELIDNEAKITNTVVFEPVSKKIKKTEYEAWKEANEKMKKEFLNKKTNKH